ncbi:MAG: peptide-methionine (R)-S-oxide reductase [Verrucomicrobiales bacterium]
MAFSRSILFQCLLAVLSVWFTACDRSADSKNVRTEQIPADPGFSVVPAGSSEAAIVVTEPPRKQGRRVVKTVGEWGNLLPDLVFRVTRLGETEPRFTGKLYRTNESGQYQCFCCEEVLFSSTDRYDSGTGWPAFTQPISPELVWTKDDASAFRARVTVMCSVCDAHLGHVFDDGPPPAGKRYSVNASALTFVAEQ